MPGRHGYGRQHPGDRPGHHQHARDRVRPGRPAGGQCAARARAALSARRLGRARRRDHLARHPGTVPRGAGPGKARCRGDRRDRHHQSARDRGALGARQRQARAPRDRLAGPAHRGPLRAAGGGWPRGAGDGADRSGDRPLFLGHQARLAAGRGAGRPGGRGARRAGVRYHRQLPAVASHGGQGPRQRCQQCSAHHAVRHSRAGLGRRPAAPAGHPARGTARGGRLQRAPG